MALSCTETHGCLAIPQLHLESHQSAAQPGSNSTKRKIHTGCENPQPPKRVNVPNVTSPQTSSAPQYFRSWSPKLIIVLVGLPARGKSYVARKLCRYLNWLQYDTKIFNVGDKRRHLNNLYASHQRHTASFFDPNDCRASRIREVAAMATLEELLDFLLIDGGSVALFDATNTTLPRRRAVVERVKQRAEDLVEILFLESQCFDEEVTATVRNETIPSFTADYFC